VPLTTELALTLDAGQLAALADARAAALVIYRDSAAPDAEPVRKALEDAAQVLGGALRGLPPVRQVPPDARAATAALSIAAAQLAGQPMPSIVVKAIANAYGAGLALLATRKALSVQVFAGVPVVIEYPVGATKSGTAVDGTEWTRVYQNAYGFVATGQNGGDGEALDVYIGPDDAAPFAWWVHQQSPAGIFDEYKLVLGAATETDAREIYLAHTPAKFLGRVTKMSMPVLRAMLGIDDGATAKAARTPLLNDVLAGRAPIAAAGAVTEAVHKVMPFADSAGESRYILGVVLEPQDPNAVTDGGGDVYSAEEIEGAFELWTEGGYGNFDRQHGMLANHEFTLLDNFILRCDEAGIHIRGRFIKRGSWLVGARCGDQAWADVKSGKLAGYSMNGLARRTPLG